MIYNGNLDIICDHSGILNMFAKMNTWSAIDDYFTTDMEPFISNNQVAGYLKSVQNLRLFVMRNAGHMVPRSQPEFAFDLLQQFINGNL